MVCDEKYSEQLIDLMESSWEYLNSTGYNKDGKICPLMTHAIIAVLLIDLYAKLPPEYVKPIPESEILPGKTGNVELSEFDKQITLESETWVSTGLWLPAGVIGEIEIEEPMPEIHAHVGSHHESLISKTTPWKRWPLCVSVAPLSKTVTKVVSALGGIVYIAINNPVSEKKTISMKFKNFCKHPMADYRDPNIWEMTKDLEVPWGEIHSENLIFTLPTEKMREIGNFSKIFDIQNKRFTAISCTNCGYTELYRRENNAAWDILDFLIGS